MKIIIYITLILLSFSSLANDLRDLSEHRTWQKLLHISQHKSGNHLGDTEIETPSFFLSRSTSDFSHQELLLTIDAIKKNRVDENGYTFRCNYPARTYFLAEQNLVAPLYLSECPALLEWVGSEEFDVSIVYADGYLGNPASFYGHLILKFDVESDVKSLLDNSLNFGATVPDNENPVVYILKGLSGGYDSKFNSNYFYRHNLNYREVELRDLWQYQLELSARDKMLVATHAFELMRTQYTYYFTHRNCAYHLAKILEVVTQEDIIDNLHPFVLPISVFKKLSEIQIADSKVNLTAIKKITYHPSRQTRFREKFASLNEYEKNTLRTWIEHDTKINLDLVEQERKVGVLNTAYDYIEYVLTQLDKETPEYALMRARKTRLQRRLIAYPPQLPENKIRSTVGMTLPHSGHKPSLLRAIVGREKQQGFIEFQLRPAFYDELSLGGGKSPNSGVSMGDLTLRYQNGDLRLSSLSLLTIETFPLGGSGLPNDKDIAWKLRVGIEPNFLDKVSNSNEWFVESAIGKAYGSSSDFVTYAMLEGRAQTPNDIGERFYVMPKIGFVGTLFSHSKLACHLGYVASVDSNSQRQRRKFHCGASVFQSNSFDLKLSYDAYFEDSVRVGLSWYW